MGQITVFVFAAMSVACLSEWYKKALRGDGDKTRASGLEISFAALVFSAAFGIALAAYFDIAAWAVKIAATLSVFGFQYVIDMTLVKAAVRALVEKVEK